MDNGFVLDKVAPQDGRLAIVTGANTGLGFEVALALAGKNMQVILACRNRQKADLARIKIQQCYPNSRIEVMSLDLSSLKSVRQFAEDFCTAYDRLDLLINNAGIMVPTYTLTEDGFESQLGVNYLGHFLLTGLLLNRLEATPASRTISLASLSHRTGRLNFDDLQSEKRYSRWGGYARSKLACLMFAYEMQRRLDARDYQTIAVATHPGVSASDLPRNIPRFVNRYVAPLVLKVGGQTAEQGALSILHAALGDDVRGGDYIGPTGAGEWRGVPGKVSSSWRSQNREVAARLWRVSEELTGIKYLGH